MTQAPESVQPTEGVFPAPLRLLIVSAIAIFAAESLIMVIFYYYPPVSPIIEIFLDAFLVLAITLPVLYFYLYRPMIAHIHDKATAVEKAHYRSFYDILTNLPNRALFEDRLQHQIFVAEREGEMFAIVFMEIHRLTDINDALGHQYGDKVLQQVASRLSNILRKSDSIARFGGNEFAILMPGIDIDLAILTVQRLQKILETSILLEDTPISIDASLGIVLYPEHGTAPAELLRRADIATRAAKREGSIFNIYNADKDPYSRRRLLLFTYLRDAIANHELLLHYQPKVEVSSKQVKSVEALLRWRHSELGDVSPAEFIPLAEHTGLINPLTTFVVDMAFKQSSEWKQNNVDIVIAVNLSARNILDPQLPRQLEENLMSWGISPQSIELEITETAIMMESKRSLDILTTLNSMGFTIAIDDFGTGYSSLSYLSQLPVQKIKIDICFVRDMLSNRKNAMIVRSTIDLAHSLELKVIAEGVEDKATWDQLEALGCDMVQGYYTCRPLPSSDFMNWYQNNHHTPN